MRVEITGINGIREALEAEGLASWLRQIGVDVVSPSMPLPLSAEIQGNAQPLNGPERVPTNRDEQWYRSAGVPGAPAKADDADKPRVTHRDRIVAALQKKSPLTAQQIADAVGLESAQVSNLLWNMGKAGQVVKDEDKSPIEWRLK